MLFGKKKTLNIFKQSVGFNCLRGLTYGQGLGLVILEVEHGDLVTDGREDRVPVRAKHQVAGPVHRPVQVRKLVRELHFLF